MGGTAFVLLMAAEVALSRLLGGRLMDTAMTSADALRLIEEAARGAAYVLVPEPPTSSGALKTARKGVGQFRLSVTGRAAHG